MRANERPPQAGRASETARIIPRHEPSAWLRQTMARRVADIRALGVDMTGYELILCPLGRTGGRHERSCDRCGRWTPPGEDFYTMVPPPLHGITFIVGLCSSCTRYETGGAL